MTYPNAAAGLKSIYQAKLVGLILPAQRQRVLRADGPAHAAAGAAGVIDYDLAVPDGNGAVQAAVDTFAAAIAAAGKTGGKGTGWQLLKGHQRIERQPADLLQ